MGCIVRISWYRSTICCWLSTNSFAPCLSGVDKSDRIGKITQLICFVFVSPVKPTQLILVYSIDLFFGNNGFGSAIDCSSALANRLNFRLYPRY